MAEDTEETEHHVPVTQSGHGPIIYMLHNWHYIHLDPFLLTILHFSLSVHIINLQGPHLLLFQLSTPPIFISFHFIKLISRLHFLYLCSASLYDLFFHKQMKIQCAVCNKDEAAVFCPADEAALCDACDHRVHHANKLAGKHQRFSLLQPSSKQSPICDICQEKRAFLFCQQDRAILCEDCDISIHKANEHTKNHNRFLLTGVKLSATSDIYSSPSSSVTNNCEIVPSFNKSRNSVTKSHPITSPVTDSKAIKNANPQLIMKGDCNGPTSSISEYLEMLPGWHVEDFLDSSALDGFPKTGENDMLPFWDDDVDGNLRHFSSENIGIWVPQAPAPLYRPHVDTSSNMDFGSQICFKDPKEATTNIRYSKRLIDDGGFTVPQISPSISSKRSRTLW